MGQTVWRRVVIEGRVQGVGFRAFVARLAEEHALAGNVTNRPDGAVECLIGGDPEGVRAVMIRLHKGPPLARVSSVAVTELEPGELGPEETLPARFSIL